MKNESEKFWHDIVPNKHVYGYQVQQGCKWRPGLNDNEIQEFEKSMNMPFPESLRNFYKAMNGLTKQGINVYGNSGTPPTFRPFFYSYPDDLELIKEQINSIYDSISVKKEDLENLNISRIFPVYPRMFMLIDVPGSPILSAYVNDIVYYADNLSKLLANEILSGVIYNPWDFESPPQSRPEVKFWLD